MKTELGTGERLRKTTLVVKEFAKSKESILIGLGKFDGLLEVCFRLGSPTPREVVPTSF